MLRWLFVLLVVSNLLYWALHQDPVMQTLGLPRWDTMREPERLARQVHPERIQQVAEPAQAASAASAPLLDATGAGVEGERLCWVSRPLTDEQLSLITRQLVQVGLRSDRWLDIRRELPGRWAVYMGRYADDDQLQRKLDELRRLKMTPEELVNHAQFSPGLTLGQFDNEPEARARLAQLQNRGVRTARVVALKAPVVEHRLRLDNLVPALAQQLSPATQAQADWSLCDAP
jgi:hypothetical protein